MSEWRTVDEIPPMLGELDDGGYETTGTLLVYVAERDAIAFGECRVMRTGPRFKAFGYTGFAITHWCRCPFPLPPPPSL